MFRFQDHHQEAIQQNAVREFIAKTILFLRENKAEWSEAKDDQEVQDYIESIIAFAESCSIDEALAVQKLAFYKIELGFSLPPESRYHHARLCRAHFDDSYRVDQFVNDYEQGIDFVVIEYPKAASIKSKERERAPNSEV
jgi:hypothetical protein